MSTYTEELLRELNLEEHWERQEVNENKKEWNEKIRVKIQIREENKWRKSIKSRFPLLSIITNYMSLWTAGAVLTLVSFWLYRRRRKRLFAKWEEEQAPLLVEEEQPPEP